MAEYSRVGYYGWDIGDDATPFSRVTTTGWEISPQTTLRALGSVSLAAIGHATLTGDPDAFTRYWRVPSNASQGTAGRMIVFAAGNPATTVAYEGSVTADANGYFNLSTSDNSAVGTKRFTIVHAWNGVTATTSIFGGPSISELIQV